MTQQFFILLLFFTLTSCRQNNHEKEDMQIVRKVLDKIDCESANLNYSQNDLPFFEDRSEITLTVVNCRTLLDKGKNTRGIASLAAHILVNELHKETLEGRPGIRVVFEKGKDTSQIYFSTSALKKSENVTKNIERYVNLIKVNDTINASTLVDNSFADFSIRDFNNFAKSAIKNNIKDITCMYDIIKLQDKQKKSINTYAVLTIIEYADNSYIKIDFFAHTDPTNDKLIGINIRR